MVSVEETEIQDEIQVELLSVKIFARLDKLSNGILHLYFICAFTLGYWSVVIYILLLVKESIQLYKHQITKSFKG